ncbi:lachesin-like [Babylonia areolata]|uniref:lachesin-like n=1 Tax=Babylonia areolata TaxID=304850 RepID=UPI003FD48A87
MARGAWWIPVLHMAWFVLQADTERSGESARQGTQPEVVTYNAGQMAVLYCSVSDRRGRTVTWRKLPNRNPLTIETNTWVKDKRIHAEHVPNSSQWNLVIERVNVSDAGTYECRVSARGVQFRHQVILQVRALPPKSNPRIEISGRNYIRQGEDIHLECDAAMIDVDTDGLQWLKNSRPLVGQVAPPRLHIETTVTLTNQLTGSVHSSLRIAHAQVSDSGEYVCRSTERSQLAGMKLEVKPDSVNSKRAENIQQYKGVTNGQPCSRSTHVLLLSLLSVVGFLRTSLGR